MKSMTFYEYCKFFLGKKLHRHYDLEDCLHEALLHILVPGKRVMNKGMPKKYGFPTEILKPYLLKNTLPRRGDPTMKYLRTFLYFQRLAFINSVNMQETGSRTMNARNIDTSILNK